MEIIISVLVSIVIFILVDNISYQIKQAKRVSRLEDDQRYINNERKGWKW